MTTAEIAAMAQRTQQLAAQAAAMTAQVVAWTQQVKTEREAWQIDQAQRQQRK